MSAITAKASRKMKKYAVLTREPRCFLGSFDFSWEQRKLNEVVNVYDGVHQTPDYKDSGVMFLSVENISTLKSEKYISEEAFQRDYKVYPQKGDILMTRIGDVGTPNVVETTEKVAFYVSLALLKPTKINSYFLCNSIQSPLFQKGLKDRTLVTAIPQKINKDEIGKVYIILPTSSQEQQLIGEYFRKLDNLITLHQRKCANLCSPSQVVFSLLFATSTFSWEQRKLSEMCGTFEYGLNAAAKEFDGKNKYIRITDIDDASREFLLSDLSSPDICLDGMSKYLLSSGDIVFARTGASVGKTYIYRENDGIVYFAGFLIRAKVNQDNDAEFVFQSTLSPSYEKYIRITSQRSGQPGVNAQEYGEYDLFAPSKEEQQRIGHFLRGIDNLITLHQRQPFFIQPRIFL